MAALVSAPSALAPTPHECTLLFKGKKGKGNKGMKGNKGKNANQGDKPKKGIKPMKKAKAPLR